VWEDWGRPYAVEAPKACRGKTLEDVLRSGDELERWMCLLHVGCNDAEATRALSERNEAMEGYMRLHERATASPEVRMRHDHEMSAILDENYRIKRAEEKGFEEWGKKAKSQRG